MRSSTPISPCTHRSSGVVTRMPPPATVSSVIAATMAAPPSQRSRMCPASSTVSSLPAWTSSVPSTVVCRCAATSASPWPVCSWSVACTRTRSRPATRSAFVCERPASMRSDTPRRSASPPTSCSMVSDRISRAKASSTGRKSMFETGSVTDGSTKAGSGSAGGKGAAGFATVSTGCAGIGVADRVASSMRTPPGPRGIGHECSIRGSIRGWRRICGRGSLLVVPAGPPPRSKDARLRHGEGSGTWRMRASASIARQSMSVMATAAARSTSAVSWSCSRSASTGRHRVADQRSASPPSV